MTTSTERIEAEIADEVKRIQAWPVFREYCLTGDDARSLALHRMKWRVPEHKEGRPA